MNTLTKHLVELRMGMDQGGVWARAIGKRFEFSERSSRDYTQDISGVDQDTDQHGQNGKGFLQHQWRRSERRDRQAY
ncbi:autotransporter outer membrane beta-barrel domain-containing protein [Pseudomonas sp. A1230]|uniref:autotransporter outer membrane beta-barrel domain-containing protein n=1 Tax=Pseudomonas sp. A1230 TaxID=3235106 RepID=UPI003782D3AE